MPAVGVPEGVGCWERVIVADSDAGDGVAAGVADGVPAGEPAAELLGDGDEPKDAVALRVAVGVLGTHERRVTFPAVPFASVAFTTRVGAYAHHVARLALTKLDPPPPGGEQTPTPQADTTERSTPA